MTLAAPHQDDIAQGEPAERLLKALGLERMARLADLLDEVSQDTGYGDVTIVIAESKVVLLKSEKSYR